ncbi:hypothetical protein CDD83_3979 [Cordyceps sp. RAO-2017]|nr:hypothetical protein CDD83_3979 [Cordyceps sp. RAO-2017]
MRLAERHGRQDAFVGRMLRMPERRAQLGRGSRLALLQTPVLLAHGADNAFVDAELGREACDTLALLGFSPSWFEYVGADEEGHWIKEPEGVDDIYHFLCDLA